ncbi:hypothetical protein ACVWVY_004304 [Bradyrhizobium sp. URHC0002]
MSGPNEKGSTPPETNLGNLHAETGTCGRRIWSRGRGGPPDFPRHRRPRCIAPCGGVVWLAQPVAAGCDCRHGPKRQPVDCRRLFLARWIRLPRRHMGPRRRIGPDRLRHPRGLRRAAETQQPCEEIGAMLLKHRQDRFGSEGNLCVHVVMHSARVLTDGSGETASTPKIVGDVTRCRSAVDRETMRPPVGGLIARASFPAAPHQAAGGWHPAPLHSWPKGRRPFRESPRRRPDRRWPLQTSERLLLVPIDISCPAQFGSPLLYPLLPAAPDAITHCGAIRSGGKVQK